jgi:hypothetical protein
MIDRRVQGLACVSMKAPKQALVRRSNAPPLPISSFSHENCQTPTSPYFCFQPAISICNSKKDIPHQLLSRLTRLDTVQDCPGLFHETLVFSKVVPTVPLQPPSFHCLSAASTNCEYSNVHTAHTTTCLSVVPWSTIKRHRTNIVQRSTCFSASVIYSVSLRCTCTASCAISTPIGAIRSVTPGPTRYLAS